LYLADAGPKAVEYLLRAAERSKKLYANDEAVRQLTHALELLERCPDTPDRARQEFQVQVALASPLIAVRGHGALEVERLCERARHLGHHVRDTSELFSVLFGLVGFHAARGNLGKASEFGEQLLSIAEDLGDESLTLVASFAQGVTLFYRGQLIAARDHLERGCSIYRPEEHASLALRYTFDPGVACARVLALVRWLLGYPDHALACGNDAIALARRAGQPYGLAGAMLFTAMVHHCRGEAPLAGQLAEAAAVQASEHGFPLWLAWSRLMRGWALVQEATRPDADVPEEHVAETLAELKADLAAYEASGSQIFRPYWMALTAEAHLRAGRAEEALSLVICALQVAEDNDERWWEAELWRMKAELSLGLPGKRDEADSDLRHALAMARQQGARAIELRAALSLTNHGNSAREP
jgi:predicted ATPase